jgi:hypothetical protein
MDTEMHKAIEGKLEASRSAGWLSDYLVAWHGPSGELLPKVSVWPRPGRSADAVRAHLSTALSGLVGAAGIVVEV